MDMQTLDFNGEAPIHIAAGLGDVAALRILIAAGGSTDQGDIHNNTALYKAACSDQVAFVKALISLGCDFDKMVVEETLFFSRAPVCGHVARFASPESSIIFRSLIALYPKIPMKAWDRLPKYTVHPIAREKLDILFEHKESLEHAPTAFWKLAYYFVIGKETRMLAYLFHLGRAMKIPYSGWYFYQSFFFSIIYHHSKTFRIFDRQCLSGVNIYDLAYSPQVPFTCLSDMRQLVCLSLSIRNRTLDIQISGLRDFTSKVILPRAKDDFAISNLRRLQELAHFGGRTGVNHGDKQCAEFQNTLHSLPKSLGDILRAVAKSKWQDAEEVTRDLLDRLEEVRSSDIWPLIESGFWTPKIPFQRHEVWDYGSDDEDEDQNEGEGGDDKQERENPWIGRDSVCTAMMDGVFASSIFSLFVFHYSLPAFDFLFS